MKRLLQIKCLIVLWIGLVTIAFPQTQDVDHVKVPIKDLSHSCTVRVSLIAGSISVKGYSGNDVIIDARARDNDEERDRKAHSKSGGMSEISHPSAGLIIEEESDTLRISTSVKNRPVDITLQVPTITNLNLTTINDGDIQIEQVQGEIEVNNTNGSVTLIQVSGSVVAHALNKDLKAIFLSVDAQKSMSFSSLNGNIDVTLPSDVKANVSMKSDNGDIYSDFDIVPDSGENQPAVEDTHRLSSKYHIKTDRTAKVMINGGGQEMQFKTFNGNIYIRKSKAAHGSWTLISGDKQEDQKGVYGSKGVAASANKPGARSNSIGWIDGKDNLWLFGGHTGIGIHGCLNDLWRFDGTNWTWISGDNEINQSGVYGTMGIAAATNKPGARYGSISWIDNDGNLWLFGGFGYAGTRFRGSLNDLWKFDGTNWTWISGDSKKDQIGVYGIKGVAASTNKPGARHGGIAWKDAKGNLWLFGGHGYDQYGAEGDLNDLWEFNGKNWIWVSGDSTRDKSGVYGIKGVAESTNKPGARHGSVSWIDSSGNLWLFGGHGYANISFITENLRHPHSGEGHLKDLWKFDGYNWTWVAGENEAKNFAGGTTDKDRPSARYGSTSWIDTKNTLWLFGGNTNGRSARVLNDLWKFDESSWTLVSEGNIPGPHPRNGSIGWIDSNGNLWLFGGCRSDIDSGDGFFNDLWKFDSTN